MKQHTCAEIDALMQQYACLCGHGFDTVEELRRHLEHYQGLTQCEAAWLDDDTVEELRRHLEHSQQCEAAIDVLSFEQKYSLLVEKGILSPNIRLTKKE